MPRFDRRRALAASEDEVRRLGAQHLSEVTPSRRDFAQYVATQKTELAVIARVAAHTAPADRAAALDYAAACDDAEVAALAVATELGGLSVEDLAAIAAATTAPILREALTIDARQLYDARLRGIDAALFPVSELDATTLHDLVAVAGSLHMASVAEVLSATDVDKALVLPHVIVGLRCERTDGSLDVEQTRRLAQRLPRTRTTIVLPEAASLADYGALRGVCDAVVAGDLLRTAVDLAATLRQIANG